jgi:hypothetical protein
MRIVSWRDIDCIGGKSNMKYILSAGDELRIKYIYEVEHSS